MEEAFDLIGYVRKKHPEIAKIKLEKSEKASLFRLVFRYTLTGIMIIFPKKDVSKREQLLRDLNF